MATKKVKTSTGSNDTARVKKIAFRMLKNELNFIDFATGEEDLIQAKFSAFHETLFRYHERAFKILVRETETDYETRRMSIKIVHGCEKKTKLSIFGSWKSSSQIVYFSSQFYESNYNCTLKSVTSYYQRRAGVTLGLKFDDGKIFK